MADSILRNLQSAVRRRLWRGQFVAAARLALWGSAGLMLLAVAVHLAARPVRVGDVIFAIATLWTVLMAWAAWRRPSASACALWADRHLGGESAYSTLLELREGRQAAPNAAAVQWLEHWAAANVRHSLRLLGERRDSARLSKPLLSALVCIGLATIVLMLPGPTPSAPQAQVATSGSGDADRPTPDAERASTEIVSALANALRSTDSRHASDRRDENRAPAGGPGNNDASTVSRIAPPGGPSKGERTTASGALPSTIDGAASTAVTRQASGAGSGRDAGDSRDDRADAGASRVPRGTIQAQRRESTERRPSPERQADADQLATFDDGLAMHDTATVRENPAVAAAIPPPATDTTPLTPTRAAYVQAWMKASRQRR